MSGSSAFQRRLQGVRRKTTIQFQRRVVAPLRRLRNSRRDYRPCFVAGASGGGTSLMALSLAQRFECAGVIQELDIQISHRSVLSVPRLSSFRSLSDYESVVRPRDDWSVDEARRDLQNTFRAYCEGPDGVVFVKGPDINLARASFLARCFPDAPFAMIFRDPAANLEGYRRKWRVFGDATLSDAICFYAEIYETFLTAAESFGERVVGVEYEKLVANPDAIMGEVGRRLGLVPATDARRFETKENVAGKGVRNIRDGKIEMVADASRKSIDRLAAEEVAEIRESLGPLYAKLQSLPCVV